MLDIDSPVKLKKALLFQNRLLLMFERNQDLNQFENEK